MSIEKQRKLNKSLLEEYINLHYVPEPEWPAYYYNNSVRYDLYDYEPVEHAYKPQAKPVLDKEEHEESYSIAIEDDDSHIAEVPEEAFVEEDIEEAAPPNFLCGGIVSHYKLDDIDNITFEDLDISFGEALKMLVKGKGLTGPQFQARANISAATYSNLINNPVTPKKKTILACLIGLKLNLEESEELLRKAGYAFSNSDLTDVIVKCYIENKVYDIDDLNIALFDKDLQPLGQAM